MNKSLARNNKSCTGGKATKKREIPAQQKQGEIQVKIIAATCDVRSFSPRTQT